MTALPPRALATVLAGLLTLGGCSAYDDGYGYGGVSLGYGSGYHDPWYYDRYGWYDGFYYPGSGYYVYDRYGKRHRWNNHHRHYWQSRQHDRDGRREWRDRDHDREGRWQRQREWRGQRDNNSSFWRGRERLNENRARDLQRGRQRDNAATQGRSRPAPGLARPSLREERSTRGPRSTGEWKRKD